MLIYESFRDIPAPINVTRPVVTFVAADTGELIREMLPAFSYGGLGMLSPDDTFFVVRGADLKGRGSFLKVDATTGAATVLAEEPCSRAGAWGPDDRSFFCYDFGKKEILQVDFNGRVVRRYPSEGQGLGTSPDGRYLFIAGPRLSVTSLATGQTRDLLPAETLEGPLFRAWTPDSRNLIAYGRLKGEQALWMIPIDGSTPSKINVTSPTGITSWAFHPKTGQVMYRTGGGRWQLEVWKLENYQSATRSASSR